MLLSRDNNTNLFTKHFQLDIVLKSLTLQVSIRIRIMGKINLSIKVALSLIKAY